MSIPLFDPTRAFASQRPWLERQVAEAAFTGEFILRQKVRALESGICHQTGATHAIATANGTGAIQLAMHALGVGPGTEVLLPAFGFPSPVNCVLNLGGSPRFVDVERDGGMMDPTLLRPALSSRTRAIVPMHLGRALADMHTLRSIADDYNVALIEDSAVALGATIDGGPAGRFGRAGVYSFFAHKPLGGIADAGMLITGDGDLALRCRRLRNHGQADGGRFIYREVGYNNRMDEIAAGFLLQRLNGFAAQIACRREIASFYDNAFAATSYKVVPMVTSRADVGHHRYVVIVDNPAAMRAFLKEAGIESDFFHPVPLHLQPAYAHLGYGPGDFPVAEWLAQHSLMLPFFPEMEQVEIDFVVEKVVAYVS